MGSGSYEGQPQDLCSPNKGKDSDSFSSSQRHNTPRDAKEHFLSSAVDMASHRLTYTYNVVLEDAGTNWGAYAPDVPGCGVTGASEVEVEQSIVDAIEFLFEYLFEKHMPIPLPTTKLGTLPSPCVVKEVKITMPLGFGM